MKKSISLHIALIVFVQICCISTFSLGQNKSFEKLDSLFTKNNYPAYGKELIRLNNHFITTDDTLTKMELNVKLMEYYRLYDYNLDSVVKFYNIGVKQAEQSNNLKFLCNFKYLYGSYLMEIGKFDEALEIFNKIRPTIEKHEYVFMPHLYDSYAKLYYLTKDFDNSFHYLKLEAAIFKQRNDLPNTCATYNNLGVLYSILPNFDSSLYYHQHALDIHYITKDTFNLIRTYSNIASIYIRKKEMERVDSIYNLAFKLNPTLDNKELITNYASVLTERKEYAAAEDMLTKILNNNPSKQLEKVIFGRFVDLYRSNGNLSRALEYSEKLRNVSEELLDETKIEAIERLTVEFETEQKEKAIEKLQILTANQTLEISKNRLQTLISIAVLLVVILIFLLFYRNKTFQSKLSQLTMEQKLLRSKMNPHFIFNSLSNIQSNILKGENQTAVKYLVKFSKLLRYNLEQSTHDAVNLNEEIKSIEDYLDMQNLRLNGILTYTIHLEDGLEIDDLFIPGMMLQPIVENCLEHGLEGNTAPKIWINVSDKNDHLLVEIEDNGIGLDASQEKTNPNKKSHASDILHRRLKLLSKDLDINLFYSIENKKNENGETTGAKATIALPLIENKA